MSTHRRPPNANAPAGDKQPSAVALTQMAQRQMAATAEALSVFYAASHRFQRAQLQMAERAALLHQQAAENLRKATTPADLMTVQMTLMGYEWQECMRWWQDVFLASTSTGNELLKGAQAQQAGVASGSSDGDPRGAGGAAANFVGSAMNAAAPMVDAFQQMFTAPLNSGRPH